MSLLLAFTSFVIPNFLFTNSLICPVYNLFHNETQTCEQISSLCTYIHTSSPHRRCLGIYQFEKHSIRIRQLALLDDYEGKYVNTSECLLEIDRTGQNLLCRCNSNNCTFNWRINRQFLQRIETIDNYWFIPLIITFGIVVLVFVLLIVINYFWKRTRKEKNDGGFFGQCPSISTNISNTEIEEFLASNSDSQSILHHGKTSIIYRAWTTGKEIDPNDKKLVTVKLYHQHDLFDNEFQILRMIKHSNIINLISHGWYGHSPYLILDYHDLGSLRDYLRLNKLSWSVCYSFLHSLIDAIDYLHHEELSADHIRKAVIIHRDIKSSNILLKSTPDLRLCLTDFGLGKILPPMLTSNDFIQIGTYRYMAPELLELAITHTAEALCKVDIYALGLVMWEIVTQCEEYPSSVDYQLPYEEYVPIHEKNENKILDILHRVIACERKRPVLHRTTTINSKLSDLFTIIEDCWKHEPEFRINVRPALHRLRRLV